LEIGRLSQGVGRREHEQGGGDWKKISTEEKTSPAATTRFSDEDRHRANEKRGDEDVSNRGISLSLVKGEHHSSFNTEDGGLLLKPREKKSTNRPPSSALVLLGST